MVSQNYTKVFFLSTVRKSFVHNTGNLRDLLCAVTFVAVSVTPLDSHAVGNLKMESSGFFRKSADRPDSVTMLSIGPQAGGTGKYLESKLDAEIMVQVNDKSSLTGEARDLYVATSPRLMWNHQVSVGRRDYDWSSVDDAWKFGMYTPRFNWDPTRLEQVGMTGLFYQFKSNHLRALAYGSPISVPERGYPMKEENGKFVSSNPFSNPLPENTVIAKVNLPIAYHVEMPSMSKLLTNGGGAVSLKYFSDRENRGFFTQVNFAYLPIHQPHLAIEPAIKASQPDQITVDVHPAVVMHQMITTEIGYAGTRSNAFFSVTQENPESRSIPSNWIGSSLEPAQIVSGGGAFMVGRKLKLKGSAVYVTEDKSPTVENNDFKVDLPGRFMYRRAAQVGVEVYANSRMTYELKLINDLETDSQMASADVTYNLVKKDRALTLSLGSDFFASATSKGWFGQYKGNDRFRGGVSYAF